MSSFKTIAKCMQPSYGKRNLQRLRRKAGYRSAKDFAKVLCIPVSVYSRYEQEIEGSECDIPLRTAWAIADKLGCSIDLVVGRSDIEESEASTINARVRKLSSCSRETLNDFLCYLESRESNKVI